MRKTSIFLPILFSAVLLACSDSKDDVMMPTPELNCDPTTSTFTGHVSPIIRTTCATKSACHGEGSLNGPAALTSYAAIKNAAANIRRAVSTGTMPKSGSLTADQKKAIICWVDLGAPNN